MLTHRQTDKLWQKHNLLGGDKYRSMPRSDLALRKAWQSSFIWAFNATFGIFRQKHPL